MREFNLIWLVLVISSCSSNSKNLEGDINKNTKDSVKVNYGLAIVSYLEYMNTNKIFCSNVDFNVKSKFKVEKLLKGNLHVLENEIINLYSCEHWYENPYEESRGYRSLGDDYDYKWLVLFEEKKYGYHIISKEMVFKLKNNKLRICPRSRLIKELLNKKNEPLGENVGVPVSIDEVLNPNFYLRSPCETVENGYIYLNKGIRL